MIIGAACAHFRRDMAFDIGRACDLMAVARSKDVDVVVLPQGVLGGYHDRIGSDFNPEADGQHREVGELPPAVDLDGPEVAAILAGTDHLTVCFGFTERGDNGLRHNTAVCAAGGQILGIHRKVHLPVGERTWYEPGDRLEVFDTPVGPLGMLIDYDKTFPEAARTLAVAGARIVAVPSAWPASRTNTADTMVRDRQRLMFDLYDQARAAENQVVVASANQVGRCGGVRFIGQSKIVRPDGSIAATTGFRAGLAVAEIDVDASIALARRRFDHQQELRPDLYRLRPAPEHPCA